MRMFKKKDETNEKVIYEYLCEDYTLPYTGLIEIDKKNLKTEVLKAAAGEWSEKKAAACAMITLPKMGYPDRLTHNAV